MAQLLMSMVHKLSTDCVGPISAVHHQVQDFPAPYSQKKTPSLETGNENMFGQAGPSLVDRMNSGAFPVLGQSSFICVFMA